MPSGDLEDAPADHAEDAEAEGVGRDREDRAGLAHPAQVHQHQDHDHADRAQHLVRDEERHGGAEVLDAGGDRHRHRQHVVHQQRAGDGQARLRAQVGGGDLVVAAAGGVGVHVLPVGGDDGEHQHHDRDRDPRAEVVGRDARDRQDQQHLARCVGHGGQRVGGEDGQREALGEQRLPQLVAAQRPADQNPFRQVGQFGHPVMLRDRPYGRGPTARRSVANLCTRPGATFCPAPRVCSFGRGLRRLDQPLRRRTSRNGPIR